MIVKTTTYLNRIKKTLRSSQIRQLDQEIKNILANPQIGVAGSEEMEYVRYHRYEDKYGKMLLTYTIEEDKILFYSISKISQKI